MFIIGWLVIIVLRANEVVIPGIVSGIIGWLAILEATLYTLLIVLNIITAVVVTRRIK